MKKSVLVIALIFTAASLVAVEVNAPPGPGGPQGPKEPQGPQMPLGPQGTQGPAGPSTGLIGPTGQPK